MSAMCSVARGSSVGGRHPSAAVPQGLPPVHTGWMTRRAPVHDLDYVASAVHYVVDDVASTGTRPG